MIRNKTAFTLLFALTSISSCAIAAPEASAQSFLKASASDLPAAHQFYKHRPQWQIVKTSPDVTDVRPMPEPVQQFKVLIPALSAPQSQGPLAGGTNPPSSGPIVITPVANELPDSRFASNLPASGLKASRLLPSGKSTNLLAGQLLPASNQPRKTLHSKPLVPPSKPQMQQICSYPSFKPAGSGGSQKFGSRTSVKATLKPGTLLHR